MVVADKKKLASYDVNYILQLHQLGFTAPSLLAAW
jgi:hypothetical protein